jgi:hypothetical protein
MAAYKFARRLKTLGGLTSDYVIKSDVPSV